VQKALLDIVKFWLDKGVDGLRLDVANHYFKDKLLRDNPSRASSDRTPDRPINNTYDMQWHKHDKSQPENLVFLEKLRALTDQYKDRMMVAELGDDDNIGRCIEYTAPGRLHTAYSFSLLTKPYGAGIVRKNIEDFRTRAQGQSWPCWAFSNHDAERVATRWAPDGKASEAQAKMLLALVCSLWGTIFIYQGEELGLADADVPFEKLQDPFGKFLWPAKGRDGCRTPLPWEHAKPHAGFSACEPWLPVERSHQEHAIDVQEKDTHSPLRFFRTFITWRKRHEALRSGDIHFLEASEPLLAFARDKTLAVFNMGGKTETYSLPAGVKPLDGHGLPCKLEGNSLTLPPYGGFFGELT
jgi:alpha-glucosidase